TLLAAWRSRARMTSRPRSVPPCASFKTTRKKSPPSTKSHRSDMPLECLVIYVLINRVSTVQPAHSQGSLLPSPRRGRELRSRKSLVTKFSFGWYPLGVCADEGHDDTISL